MTEYLGLIGVLAILCFFIWVVATTAD